MMTPMMEQVVEAPRARQAGDDVSRAREACGRAVEALLTHQHADGHWCAELEGDSILISEYLLMKAILGHDVPGEVRPGERALWGRMLVHLRRLRRADGTWGQYPGSGPDLSATVKAYFALKLFGELSEDQAQSAVMRRTRERVLELGGAERVNTFSMFYLACLGQVGWEACPSIPPEIVLLPRWSAFHLTKVSAWTRTMIVPLAVCSALRPVREVESWRGMDELFVDRGAAGRGPGGLPLDWGGLFRLIDRALKWAQRSGLALGRERALKEAEHWMLRRMEAATTEGLGAIFPPMVYAQVALRALGYARSHPVIVNAERELDRFIVDAGDHARIQPCFSPVWDTGIALYALTEAGLGCGDERIGRTCRWLLDREVRLVGDWHANLRAADRAVLKGMGPGHAHGAWAFEYRNDWYPDVDDTAMVCKALFRAARGRRSALAEAARSAARRGIAWILAMQNDDGGWAAFDRTRHREWMEHVPFADHNAMQDPSCADITGRTLEALVTCGVEREHAAVRAGVAFLARAQREQGCWWGRWGVNFLYGTWQAVGGVRAAGVSADDPMLRRTLGWLRSVQREDGGFGESAESYLDESRMGRGPATASQTAWGLCAMMELAGCDDPGVRRGVRWLMEHQLDEDAPATSPEHILSDRAGLWRESWFTGTGFPKVFYLRYHHYRAYFPVMALARYVRLCEAGIRMGDA